MENRNANQPGNYGQNSGRRPDSGKTKSQGAFQDRKNPSDRNRYNDKYRNAHNAQAQSKPKEQRTPDKQAPEQNREKPDQRFSQHGGRFGRNSQSRAYNDVFNRSIKPKREETIEDIQADIERVEKDIQFEIKQIRSIKLGL
jgi:hypothetical protein